jgi:hypothetical protein
MQKPTPLNHVECMGGDLEFATFVVTVVAEKGKLVTMAQLKGGTL